MSSQDKKKMKRRVFVGLSGGVDSSVSAALLKRAGFSVTGVFIKTWTPDWLECTWKEDRLDAMRVCAKLEIPFTTLSLEKEYKRDVVDYMIAEYKAGRTPNPDVMCNKHIKFGGFYDWAMKEGADYVATGHYARLALSVKRLAYRKGTKNKFSQKLNAKRHTLCAGFDDSKDQSYFLWQIRKEQLPHVLFPVGHLEKSEVRKLAKKFDLPTALKKDSQGLCFMGKIDVKDFLSHYIKPKRGRVLNGKNEEIGYHDGAAFLTIGERHGFTVLKKTPNDKPYFIVAKDIGENTIQVSHKSAEGDLPTSKNEIVIRDVNWIRKADFSTGSSSKNPAPFFARVRYRGRLERVRIDTDYGTDIDGPVKVRVLFEKPQIVAAGQSVVIYQNQECLGGGIVT